MVGGIAWYFRNEGGYVLIDVLGKHGLYDEHVCGSIQGLEHSQIIYISVIVEVQV